MTLLNQVALTFGDQPPDQMAGDREAHRYEQERQARARERVAEQPAIHCVDGDPGQTDTQHAPSQPEPTLKAR